MAQLRQSIEAYERRDAEIVVVGPESRKAFLQYWEDHDLPFVGLPDPDHSVLKQYGQEVKLFKMGRMPAQVIVDKEGMVRYAYYGGSMGDIPSNAEVLAVLDELEQG